MGVSAGSVFPNSGGQPRRTVPQEGEIGELNSSNPFKALVKKETILMAFHPLVSKLTGGGVYSSI